MKKNVLGMVLSATALCVVIVIVGTWSAGKPQTSYQKCVAVSKQLRSDEDATNYKRTFCDILDYEPGDLR